MEIAVRNSFCIVSDEIVFTLLRSRKSRVRECLISTFSDPRAGVRKVAVVAESENESELVPGAQFLLVNDPGATHGIGQNRSSPAS